jgi:hypothetical protein
MPIYYIDIINSSIIIIDIIISQIISIIDTSIIIGSILSIIDFLLVLFALLILLLVLHLACQPVKIMQNGKTKTTLKQQTQQQQQQQ